MLTFSRTKLHRKDEKRLKRDILTVKRKLRFWWNHRKNMNKILSLLITLWTSRNLSNKKWPRKSATSGHGHRRKKWPRFLKSTTFISLEPNINMTDHFWWPLPVRVARDQNEGHFRVPGPSKPPYTSREVICAPSQNRRWHPYVTEIVCLVRAFIG